jgi:small-conductance mechanosensitive channel
MKKSISILFCLFMFPLFLNTSQVNAQSSVPSCLSLNSGDHAARIECFKKNEKEFRAQIKELRTKHNIEQVNYDSFGESCPSRSSGDHAARIECFKNNDNAYQAIINELMATEVGSAVDYNNEAQRFQESTTEGQHIQQLEAKISDLEGQLLGAAKAAKSMGDALNANHVEITALKATITDQDVTISERDFSITAMGEALQTNKDDIDRLGSQILDLEGKLTNAVSPTVYDDAVRLYKEQKAQLTEANTKISDLEGKLTNAVSPTVYDDAVRLYKEQKAQLTEANTKISDLEGKLTNAVSPTVYDDAVRLYKEQKAQLTEANTKISDLEGKLANAVVTEDAFQECRKRNNHNKATISILEENSGKLRQSGSCLKNKITDYASAIKVVPHSTPALESYRNDVVDELGIFIKSCE